MLLPCTNSKLRASATQRPALGCKPTDFLSIDTENDLVNLIKMEISLHNTCENLKQLLASREDYSDEAAFDAVDSTKVGFLDQKNF